MSHIIIVAAQIILYIVALKAIIFGCGGPTLTGWYDVVKRGDNAC